MRRVTTSGILPGSLPRAALCVALSSVLALGFTVGQLANAPEAHAVAPLAIPAGAAAMGIGAEEALAAFAALGAVTCGWSLSSYVGASSDNVRDWTDDQKNMGLDELDEWLGKQIQTDPELAQQWIDAAQVKEGSVSGGPSGGGPSKDPKDYDNNVGWMVLTLLNCSSLATSALGFFADGIKNLMSLNGSLEETVSYPDLSVTSGDDTFTFTVSSSAFPSSPVKRISDNFSWSVVPLCNGSSVYSYDDAVFCGMFNYSDITDIKLSKTSTNTQFITLYFSHSVDGLFYMRPSSSGNFLDSSNKRWQVVSTSGISTSPYRFGVSNVSLLSPQLALLLDKTYTNTTQLDNKHEIADAPQAITGLDIDTIKQYLNQIASNPSTGTYTYVKPTTTVVRNTYKDNLEETKTKPEEVSPKPDEPSTPGLTVPDDYHFPDSWTDGSLKLNRMFPFFFFDDMYQIYNTWFPQSAYDSKLRIPIPGIMWGKPGSTKVLVIDFTPWEPYRDFVYYGFLALVMFGFLARLFEWWGGFAMRMDGD